MKPSKLNQSDFVQVFGGVYEHSPWVAETAWVQEDRDNFDSAKGLAAALSRAMRRADDGRKLALIRAHPDLAGKAALADELTQESRTEQSGAGLDQCTRTELADFTKLNNAYTQQFSFPFIIAVKGHNVRSILAEFRRRLTHDKHQERAEALRQIDRIAGYRIEEILA
ncbi:MAG: OHCU decarboxylase [Robiginitomaculum sp.]|nr:MAG: OHCU decarboxylase [Robiginitomaculum sp.]